MSQASDSPTAPSLKTRELTGQAELNYIDQLERIIRAARLNLHYPASRALRSHIGVLHPDVHRGLYPGVQVNLGSGLPSYREWTRAQTDVQIAPEQLQKLGARSELERQARASDAPIYQKLLAKFDYYSDLQGRELAPLGDMTVALRKIDAPTRTAYFHIVLDKLEASGLFVRYSIDLAQTDSAWSRPLVRLDAEDAAHTEQLKSLVYKCTALGSESTFIKLAALGGVRVERVARGSVGPIIWQAKDAPEALRPLMLAGGAGAFIAQFGLDMLANDIAEDRQNDPLATRAQRADQRLSPKLGAALRSARQKYGVRVFSDRKFVVPRSMVAAVREFCAAHGTQNLIYSI